MFSKFITSFLLLFLTFGYANIFSQEKTFAAGYSLHDSLQDLQRDNQKNGVCEISEKDGKISFSENDNCSCQQLTKISNSHEKSKLSQKFFKAYAKKCRIVLPDSLSGITTNKEYEEQGLAKNITKFIREKINILTGFAGVLAVLMIVWYGFRMTTSGVIDPEETNKAKSGLIWSIAALILILFSYVIIKTFISLTFLGNNKSSDIIKGNEKIIIYKIDNKSHEYGFKLNKKIIKNQSIYHPVISDKTKDLSFEIITNDKVTTNSLGA
jgi:hypothetical protein